MHVQSIRLQRFKQFEDTTLDFRDPVTGVAPDAVVLVGPNGCGKSTVLQALALTLGLATGRLKSVEEFHWPGFVADRVSAAWGAPARVEVTVRFGEADLAAQKRVRKQLADLGHRPDGDTALSDESTVVLGGTQLTYRNASNVRFRSRETAFDRLGRRGLDAGTMAGLGTVYWYDEHREALSISRDAGANGYSPVEVIQRRMIAWQALNDRVKLGLVQLKEGERDLLADFEDAFGRVFPGRRMTGVTPDQTNVLAEPRIEFTDGRKTYTLEEMSAGERQIFPLLFDFVALSINNSVVLIDEAEAHLHPPLQQDFLDLLRGLGHGNQIITTTHSDAMLDVLPDWMVKRVEAG